MWFASIRPDVTGWIKSQEGRSHDSVACIAGIVGRQNGELAGKIRSEAAERMRFSGSEHRSGHRRPELRKWVDIEFRGS
jgi:hypothetical protein